MLNGTSWKYHEDLEQIVRAFPGLENLTLCGERRNQSRVPEKDSVKHYASLEFANNAQNRLDFSDIYFGSMADVYSQ